MAASGPLRSVARGSLTHQEAKRGKRSPPPGAARPVLLWPAAQALTDAAHSRAWWGWGERPAWLRLTLVPAPSQNELVSVSPPLGSGNHQPCPTALTDHDSWPRSRSGELG